MNLDPHSSRQHEAIEEGNSPSREPSPYASCQPSAANESEPASGIDKSKSGDQSPTGDATDSKPVTVRESKSGDQPPTPSSAVNWDPVSAVEDKDSTPSAPPPPTLPEPKVIGTGGFDSAGVHVDTSKPTATKDAGIGNRSSRQIDSFIQDDGTMSLTKKICLWSFAFVVLIVIVALLGTSLKKVSSTEIGVQYDIHAKQLDDAVKSGGLFLGPPGYEFIKFPSTFITVNLNNRICVSNDGLLVTFSVTFQYQMTAKNVLPAILKYRDFHKWASTVEQAGLSAIHHSCSEFFIAEFQNKRGVIQSKMEDNLRLKLEGNESSGEEGVNAVAVSLQLTYLELPERYSTAVKDRQAAKEGIELAVKERVFETTKANTALGTAREEVRKIEDTANNEAQVLLTEATLQAQEMLFSFQKEAEALVEVKEKLNFTTEGLLAYLSNKLMSEATSLKVTTGEPARLSQKDEL